MEFYCIEREKGKTREKSKKRKILKESKWSKWKRKMRRKAGVMFREHWEIRTLNNMVHRDQGMEKSSFLTDFFLIMVLFFSKADPGQESQMLIPSLWYHLSL